MDRKQKQTRIHISAWAWHFRNGDEIGLKLSQKVKESLRTANRKAKANRTARKRPKPTTVIIGRDIDGGKK